MKHFISPSRRSIRLFLSKHESWRL
jgi:hypothetical protein